MAQLNCIDLVYALSALKVVGVLSGVRDDEAYNFTLGVSQELSQPP
jgi:hypothetical protein